MGQVEGRQGCSKSEEEGRARRLLLGDVKANVTQVASLAVASLLQHGAHKFLTSQFSQSPGRGCFY
jgi:hypothetical protein